MISETQMRYGSRVSRHAIDRASVRNHRSNAAEIRAAKRGSSLASRFIGAEFVPARDLPRGGEPRLFPFRDPARKVKHVPESQFPHHLKRAFAAIPRSAVDKVCLPPIELRHLVPERWGIVIDHHGACDPFRM